MQTTEQIHELATALAKAQGAFGAVTKSKTAKVTPRDGRPGYEYTYATLDELIAATRKPLADNGLACIQPVRTEGNEIVVYTALIHGTGQQYVSPEIRMPGGGSPQNIGAAITYARRYSLSGTLGIAAEEDTDARGQDGDVKQDRQQRRLEEARRRDQGPQRLQQAPPAAADAPGGAPDQTEAGLRIRSTEYVDGGTFAIGTDRGFFYTRDKALYEIVASLEGGDRTATIVHRAGRRKDGATVRAIVSATVDADAKGGNK